MYKYLILDIFRYTDSSRPLESFSTKINDDLRNM